MSSPSRSEDHSYYTILGLRSPKHNETQPSNQELKAAYRHSLLLHHPDKLPFSISHDGAIRKDPLRQYSIDEIQTAYQTLLDPELRIAYDRDLLEKRSTVKSGQIKAPAASHLGVETFDLDDLRYTEAEAKWSHTCRCGSTIGYVVTESELEQASNDGEIYVGCAGCSLFIRVMFDVVDPSNEDENGPGR